MTDADPRVHTDAIVQHLRDNTAALLVGDAAKPDGAGWQGAPGQSEFVPYAIVWPTGGGGPASSTIEHTFDDLVAVYQLSCIGRDRQQAEWVRAATRVAMLGDSRPQLAGRRLHVTFEIALSASRDDDLDPPVWVAPDRYRLFSSPEPD